MDIFIITVLLIILAELTYILSKTPNKLNARKVGRPIFVDTSVLIDGRIIAVAESGFIGDTLMIPRSVIGELQFLADNSDNEKRARARHGLDIVKELQSMPEVNVEIFQDGSKAEEGVDERLLKLAKEHDGAVCTIDYNLNKVAQVEKIKVLNVNDLAMSLRMAYLPGEKMLLELTQKGQDGHQAIGHLTDGTMVVVEHASKFIGKTAEIEFIRSLQTAAGKMMFAKLANGDDKKIERVKKPVGTKQVVATIENTIAKPVRAVQKQPTVFHSDNHDQKLATKQTTPRSGRRQGSAPKTAPKDSEHTQVTNPQPNRSAATKRPRTSAQNEASLMRLLDSQADE